LNITAFDPPAGIDDFNSIKDQRALWSEFISFHFNMNQKTVKDELTNNGAPSGVVPQFYNPIASVAKKEPDETTADVPWTGFPKVLTTRFGSSALDVGEELSTLVLGTDAGGNGVAFTFRKQDEYVEWHADRDPKTGKVIRISFTCEAPEYWSALAQGVPSPYYTLDENNVNSFKPSTSPKGDIDAVLRLYQTLLHNPKVQKADLLFPADVFVNSAKKQKLFSAGDYNPWNRWNTAAGAVHLTHPANTLGAEINLAARATIRRKPGSVELTDNTSLICCAAYGNPNRNSDPTISGKVNAFAQTNSYVTLLNPVGLYMTDFNGAALVTPDSTPADEFWTWVRPTTQLGDRFKRYLRAVFEVPGTKKYSIEDITLAGQPLKYGGQLASLITMMLVGVVDRVNQIHIDPITCVSHGCRSRQNRGYIIAVANQDPGDGTVFVPPCDAYGDFEEVNLGGVPANAFKALSLLADTNEIRTRRGRFSRSLRITRRA
jgi:hypothetical protein